MYPCSRHSSLLQGRHNSIVHQPVNGYKMWLTHTNKHYLALQGRKLLLYATTWMCLEDIVLSKTNQSQNLMIENKTKSHSQICVTPSPGAPVFSVGFTHRLHLYPGRKNTHTHKIKMSKFFLKKLYLKVNMVNVMLYIFLSC